MTFKNIDKNMEYKTIKRTQLRNYRTKTTTLEKNILKRLNLLNTQRLYKKTVL